MTTTVFMEALPSASLLFIVGCVWGMVVARAALVLREGMGIGLWEPILRLITPSDSLIQPAHASDIVENSDFLKKISPQPETSAIMIVTGASFAMLGFLYATDILWWMLPFAALMLIISIVDYKQTFIPDFAVFLMMALGFLYALVGDGRLEDAVAGFLAAYLIAVGIQTLFDILGREGIYWGDLKYMLALGVWFGPTPLFWILLVASFLGLVFGLAARARVFPFAPFLSLAAILVLAGLSERIGIFPGTAY